MDYQTSQSPFLNIPRKKLDEAFEDIKRVHHDENGLLNQNGAILTEVFYRYYKANIPVDYWYRDMSEFVGPKVLKKYYDEVASDVKAAYKTGMRARFAGKHGIGKTMAVASILKKAVEGGKYSGLYVNLTDIIHVMLSTTTVEKSYAREQLLNVDFLVIDELDSRFMGTDNAADLFGRILEPIIRTRVQNRMPLFICTNTAKVEDSFSGPLQASLESLMNVVKLVPIVGGKDAREQVAKGDL